MSSTAATGDVLPALPPIRTAASQAPEPACSSAASSSTAPAPDAESVTLPAPGQGKAEEEAEAGGQDQVGEPTTPTSEGSRLRAPAECPPAPRKPAWAPPATPPAAKRKFPSSAAPSARRAFFPVARDLTTVFRALPPKKRIRAG
ncbi:hypothetical protein SEVIR_6G222200v4 [Setaria viridis]|uniref:Uncharacterized protein n=1 Tax=Setaria viridis TaxID=4556 RepID=A0A4U6UBB7_SETVI|nr:predicted GPI-anchored protein 58 [Setaria viridis]TKW11263.1 hypothetical protein SEVIR_6G222200v2 [Setaria viridis]